MVKLSDKTVSRIKDAIVSVLYESPRALFANEIATEIARDKEFIKKLLVELKHQGVVEDIKKGLNGNNYEVRIRWRIRPEVRNAFEKNL